MGEDREEEVGIHGRRHGPAMQEYQGDERWLGWAVVNVVELAVVEGGSVEGHVG